MPFSSSLRPWTLVVAALISAAAVRAESPPPEARVITADVSRVKGPKSTVYRRCVGAGRVAEGLRADWQKQLKVCRDAIGFEYLRCHGLLNDELGVYSEDAQGRAVYNWQYIDMVYDFLLSIGVRPFVEIGFMPEALARVKSRATKAAPDAKLSDPVFWWKANVTAPKSWERWDDLVRAMVRHWTERYGADEVRRWYFEVWNEPDYPSFFIPEKEATRRDEYFTLYAHTARAVKSVDPAYRVGGPAGAHTDWIKDFIAFCAADRVPLDFISFHAYGLGDGPGGLDVNGNKGLYLNRDLAAPAKIAHGEDVTIRESARPDLSVHITEWSASYSNHDPVHDSYFEAPYLLEQLKRTETLGSMSYWTFTDIFEESGPPRTPFEGGFGLINLQGIRKAAFFAYQFLNDLGAQELENADARSWICRDNSGGVQALFYDLTDPRGAKMETDWNLFRRIIEPGAKPPVKLRLRSLAPGTYRLTVRRTGFRENDAYSEYLAMGAPGQLTRAQEDKLRGLATGAPVEETDVTVGPDGNWERDFAMRDNEVVFAGLTPKSRQP